MRRRIECGIGSGFGASRLAAPWLASLALAVGVVLLLACGADPEDSATAAPLPNTASSDPSSATVASQDPSPEDPTTGVSDLELEFWRSVKDSEHPEELQTYLDRYPDGAFAELAGTRLARLEEETAPAVAPTRRKANPPAASPSPRAVAAPAVTSAVTPDRPATRSRKSRRQIVTEVIDRELRGFSDPRLHIAPRIPRKKLGNVADLHGIDPDDVLLLYDDGLGGGGKTGFCITEEAVHWRFLSGSGALQESLENIHRVRARKQQFLIDGDEVGVVMASDPELAAEVFADLLEALGEAVRDR